METGTLTQKIEDYAGIAQGETLPHHLWARTLYRKTLQKMSDTEVDELCLAIGDKDFLSVLTSSLSGERSCFNCPMPISIDTKKDGRGYQFGFMTETDLYAFMEELNMRKAEPLQDYSMRDRLTRMAGRYLS